MTQIETWNETHRADFVLLTKDWITRLFGPDAIEAHDIEVLADPQRSIVDKGGQLFFAVDGDKTVGCLALIRHSDKEYELSKLAVDPSAQGQGLASALFDTAIAYARNKHAVKLIIESNTVLKPALGLYAKYGFTEVKDFKPTYKRVNIKFEKTIIN